MSSFLLRLDLVLKLETFHNLYCLHFSLKVMEKSTRLKAHSMMLTEMNMHLPNCAHEIRCKLNFDEHNDVYS